MRNTIYGYENTRFFAGPNPFGYQTWYETRRERDIAVTRLEAKAAQRGLNDPHFPRLTRRIRTEGNAAWFEELVNAGILRANGIDGPSRGPDHRWGPTYDPADCEDEPDNSHEYTFSTDAVSTAAALLGRKGGQAKTERKVAASRENGRKGGRPRPQYDLLVSNHGTVWVFSPLTQAGNNWLHVRLASEPWQLLGQGVAIDHRLAQDIVALAAQEGLKARTSR